MVKANSNTTDKFGMDLQYQKDFSYLKNESNEAKIVKS